MTNSKFSRKTKNEEKLHSKKGRAPPYGGEPSVNPIIVIVLSLSLIRDGSVCAKQTTTTPNKFYF